MNAVQKKKRYNENPGVHKSNFKLVLKSRSAYLYGKNTTNTVRRDKVQKSINEKSTNVISSRNLSSKSTSI